MELRVNRDLEININVLNEELLWACRYEHLEVIKLLIENGADVSAGNNCALMMASENGRLEVVKLLIENGADVSVRNNYALQWASIYGHLEVAKLLIENGAKNEQ